MIKKVLDLRKVYPTEFNESMVWEVLNGVLASHKIGVDEVALVVLGHDARNGSNKIFKELLAFVHEELPDAKIINLGLSTTPLLYFATAFFGANLGVMVTASHNPKKYNGIKIVYDKEASRYKSKSAPLEAYAKFLVKNAGHTKLKVVFDCSNGTAGVVLKKLVPLLPNVKARLINQKPDGDFPDHGPDPLKKSATRSLSEEVKKFGADLGVVFDGDADRVFFVDELGNRVDTEVIARLLAEHMELDKVIVDAIVGGVFKDGLKVKRIVTVPVHSDIASMVVDKNIAFGFERSGHYYFNIELPKGRGGFGLDSGLLAGMHVLSAVSELLEDGNSLSNYAKQFSRKYFRDNKNIIVKDYKKVVDKVLNKADKWGEHKVSKLDGLTVQYKDWWFNIRRSTTEPVVRLNVEANSKKLLEERFNELVRLITA